jgi:hypothetical protein
MSNRRISWTHCPDDWSWREASWSDRGRALLIVLAVIGIFLAGSVR